MTRIGRYDNPYTSFEFRDPLPAGTASMVEGLETEDGAACHAVLWLPPGATPKTVVCLMHPRADFTRHYAVPGLLAAGYAVWTQNSRWVGNDSMLIHERVLLDVAAGLRCLREAGFERVVAIGNSGGGSLFSYYIAQASRDADRSTDTPGGDPMDLNHFDMPMFDGIVYLAAHPGEGLFLLDVIDPSVTDESDPVSCDWKFDMYDPANGFAPPPQPSAYSDEFLAGYRCAQRARVERIDALCKQLIAERQAARAAAKESPSDVASVRRATATKFISVYRTEADPRYCDLSLDASSRDYGSLFGYRPDIINYGPFGFARMVTPEAWLSTWSGLSSRASIPANGPALTLPVLVIDYSADNAVFPGDTQMIFDSLASADKQRAEVAGDHYGHAAPGGGEPGRIGAIREIVRWLSDRGW